MHIPSEVNTAGVLTLNAATRIIDKVAGSRTSQILVGVFVWNGRHLLEAARWSLQCLLKLRQRQCRGRVESKGAGQVSFRFGILQVQVLRPIEFICEAASQCCVKAEKSEAANRTTGLAGMFNPAT
jgi:hypothetical protein